MRHKRCYVILGKKNRFLYGAFPRTPDGKRSAKEYKNKLSKDIKIDFIIK